MGRFREMAKASPEVCNCKGILDGQLSSYSAFAFCSNVSGSLILIFSLVSESRDAQLGNLEVIGCCDGLSQETVS